MLQTQHNVVNTKLDPMEQKRGLQLMGASKKRVAQAKKGKWKYRIPIYDGPRLRLKEETRDVVLIHVWLARLIPVDKIPKSGQGSPGSISKHFGYPFIICADGSFESWIPEEFVKNEEKQGRLLLYNPAEALRLVREELEREEGEEQAYTYSFIDSDSAIPLNNSDSQEVEEQSTKPLEEYKKAELLPMYFKAFGKDAPSQMTRVQIINALREKANAESEQTNEN